MFKPLNVLKKQNHYVCLLTILYLKQCIYQKRKQLIYLKEPGLLCQRMNSWTPWFHAMLLIVVESGTMPAGSQRSKYI